MIEDKRCGTCRWWGNPESYTNMLVMRCFYQFPPTAVKPAAVVLDFMNRNDGRDCTCWEAKEHRRTLNGFPIVLSDLDLDGKPLKEQQP